MKKIAFIGTHGVRKTTYCYGLVHYLKKEGVNAEMLSEVARSSPFPINESTTETSQRWILYRQLSRELEFEKDNIDLLVCDRATLDNYAYLVESTGRKEDLDFLVREHIKTYDALFRVPITEREITSDGIRSLDKEFQKRIDLRVLELLSDFRQVYQNFESIHIAKDFVINKVLTKTFK